MPIWTFRRKVLIAALTLAAVTVAEDACSGQPAITLATADRNGETCGQELTAYCPENDFIDICINAATSVDHAVDWARMNDWRIAPTDGGLRNRGVTIYKDGHFPFYVDETKFSDISEIGCSSTIPNQVTELSSIRIPAASCRPGWPGIHAAVSGRSTSENHLPDGPIIFQWLSENGPQRNYVTASITSTCSADLLHMERVVIGKKK